jgi:iron complex transport system ATP-binding protein
MLPCPSMAGGYIENAGAIIEYFHEKITIFKGIVMPVLSIHNFSIRAWGVTLLNQLDLQLESGELLAIIGPNGAGKTSLINAIVNAGHRNQTTSGELMVCGRSYKAWLPSERAKQLALLPQLSTLNFPFTVEEVTQLGRIPHQTGKQVDNEIIEEALAALDILHLKQRLYTQLSGGEKQRVQLALVMTQIWRAEDAGSHGSSNNRLLLLDEPTSSLDLGHQQQLMKVIRRFVDQGVAIVMVAHDVNLVANHADKLLALCCGEVFAQGPPESVITSELMKKLYQVDVSVIPHPISQKPMVV